jgi:hypothetical protein
MPACRKTHLLLEVANLVFKVLHALTGCLNLLLEGLRQPKSLFQLLESAQCMPLLRPWTSFSRSSQTLPRLSTVWQYTIASEFSADRVPASPCNGLLQLLGFARFCCCHLLLQ